MEELLVQGTVDKIGTLGFASNDTNRLRDVLNSQSNINIEKEKELATQVESNNYLDKLEELTNYGREQKERYEHIENHMNSINDLVDIINRVLGNEIEISTENIQSFSDKISSIVTLT